MITEVQWRNTEVAQTSLHLYTKHKGYIRYWIKQDSMEDPISIVMLWFLISLFIFYLAKDK